MALDAIDDMLVGNVFGSAGSRVVIEEFMAGEEASFFAITDGEKVFPLVSAQVPPRARRVVQRRGACLTGGCVGEARTIRRAKRMLAA